MSRRRWTVAILVAGLLAATGLWGLVRWNAAQIPAASSDLAAYPEIDLGPLAGADATIGVTRSEQLPILVTKGGRGKTSLMVLDAHRGALTDAGPIPVDGWVVNAYPRASDRFVAVSHWVCPAKPVEGDAGLDCVTRAGDVLASQLSVYDLQTGTWATGALPDSPSSWLEDVHEDIAVLRHRPSHGDEPDRWTTVDLTTPLTIGEFTSEQPELAPNGLVNQAGNVDGWGWKASSPHGAEQSTWTGTVDGRPTSIAIDPRPLRQLHGAGRCLLIGSYRPHHLDHLHALCASD